MSNNNKSSNKIIGGLGTALVICLGVIGYFLMCVHSDVREMKTQNPINIQTSKDVKKTGPKKFIDAGQSFHNLVTKFFDKNRIKIIDESIKKKKTDFEFIIEIPTTVGSVDFFCKAKDKKLLNDKDLAMASIQGQAKKLPVIILTRGQLTKKATEMLSKEFKSIKIKKI